MWTKKQHKFFNSFSPTKGAGMFSNVQSKVSGWLPSMPSIPAMPSMPAMPSIPNIPGLKKHGNDADNASDALASENIDAGNTSAPGGGAGGDDDEDRSRYIRYGRTINDDFYQRKKKKIRKNRNKDERKNFTSWHTYTLQTLSQIELTKAQKYTKNLNNLQFNKIIYCNKQNVSSLSFWCIAFLLEPFLFVKTF